jgi:hypothetical protein
MVRLSAPPEVAAAAETILAAVRRSLQSAREAAKNFGRGAGDDRWPEVEAEFAAARKAFVNAARLEASKVAVELSD